MIKVGDKVEVITGSNKGKSGKAIKVLRKENKIIIEGVNIVKKHVKPGRTNETGGILEVEAPIHISNVKLVSEAKKEAKAAPKKEAKVETKKEVKKTTKKTSKKEEE